MVIKLLRTTALKIKKNHDISARYNHYVPVGHNSHCLGVVLKKGALNFEVMDSLDIGLNKKAQSFLKEVFESEGNKGLQFSTPNTPKQSNHLDCGLCTMYFCCFRIFDHPLPERQKMIQDIVKIRTWSFFTMYRYGEDRGDYPLGLFGKVMASVL